MKTHQIPYFLIALTGLLIISCKDNGQSGPIETMDGKYEQIGYGRVVIIDSSEFQLYDVSKLSCIEILDGPISIFGDNLSIKNDTLRLKDGINDYVFVRRKSIPELCTQELPEDQKVHPLYNFEVLASIFSDHYAYFELRKVNWDSLYNATKNKITSKTSKAGLYLIMDDMLRSFNDGHIGLDAPKDVVIAADSLRKADVKAEVKKEKNFGDLEISKMVADHFLEDQIKSSRSELIHWGIMKENVGYIQVNLMMGHANLKLADSLQGMPYLQSYFNSLEDLTSEQHTRLEVAGIKETMDTIMKELEDTQAIVLDVRFNGGGKDEVAMEIISNFNEKRHLVFNKKARIGDDYTQPNNVYLEAANKAYTRPVYLLTSISSASATEIMTLSSLLLEHVTRAGGHTEGVFSDVLDKQLPNGWVVELSNEVYLDTEGNNYEGIGIPVDIDLGYSENRQEFFRSVANDLEADKQSILDLVSKKD